MDATVVGWTLLLNTIEIKVLLSRLNTLINLETVPTQVAMYRLKTKQITLKIKKLSRLIVISIVYKKLFLLQLLP